MEVKLKTSLVVWFDQDQSVKRGDVTNNESNLTCKFDFMTCFFIILKTTATYLRTHCQNWICLITFINLNFMLEFIIK